MDRADQIMEWRAGECLSYRELAEKARRELPNLPENYDRRWAWQDVNLALEKKLSAIGAA